MLEYRSNPFQENDEGLTPIDVCKHPEILQLMREEGEEEEGVSPEGISPEERGGGVREDSEEEEEEEEEDVFAPAQEKQRTRLRDYPSLKSVSKGSSRSSAESLGLYDEEETKNQDRAKDTNSYHHHHLLHRYDQEGGGVVGSPDQEVGGAAAAGIIVSSGIGSRVAHHTPKSRPRSSLYSDLSTSSESEGENLEPPGGRSGGRKVRYHLAKMGEAKQRLLGKLEETGEAESRTHNKEEESEKEGVESDGRGSKGEEPDEAEKIELDKITEEKENLSEEKSKEVKEEDSEHEKEEMEVDHSKSLQDEPTPRGMYVCVFVCRSHSSVGWLYRACSGHRALDATFPGNGGGG